MNDQPNELVIPPVASENENAREMLRAWAVEGSLQCSIRADAWPDPSCWGILLADVARHVANANQEMQGFDPKQTIARIRELFEAELDNQTDQPKGSFIDEH